MRAGAEQIRRFRYAVALSVAAHLIALFGVWPALRESLQEPVVPPPFVTRLVELPSSPEEQKPPPRPEARKPEPARPSPVEPRPPRAEPTPTPLQTPVPTPPREMTPPDRLEIGDLEFTVVHEISPVASTPAAPSDAAGVAQIVALAAEVDRYDVPAGEVDRVRTVLLDLAHSIGSGQHTWDALRAATVVVMHYPRLGRRAMPVLMPFLNRAA